MQTGLTVSPWADTASPAARTLRAALMSRSWIVPHSGHIHSRTFKGIALTVYPQSAHRLLLGYQRSIPISSRPFQLALYSSCRTNSDQLASLIDFDRQRFFCMLLTARLSMAKGLLNRNAGNLIQPHVFRGFLERREHRGSVSVSDSFLTLKLCIGSLAQHVVVGKTGAPERPGKNLFLLRRWVKPESVCPFNFLQNVSLFCKYISGGRMQTAEPSPHLLGLKAGVSRKL